MRCVSDLEKLRGPILHRSHKLDLVWNRAQELPHEHRDPIITFLVIELDNLLVSGLRQFTKSSLLRCRTAGGLRVMSLATAASPEEAAALVLKELNKKKFEELNEPDRVPERFEQTFREPRDAFRVLQKYDASNLPTLQLGMAYNGRIFSEIGTVRNFFAHRSAGTYERLRGFSTRIGIVPLASPEKLVSSRRRGRPVSIFEDWNADLRNFFGAALK